MNVINLKFDSSITGLAGNEFGYETFENQVKDLFDWNGMNEIVFPNNIERVAISFVQGFCRDIVSKIGKSNIDKHITIKSKTEYLTNRILENIQF